MTVLYYTSRETFCAAGKEIITRDAKIKFTVQINHKSERTVVRGGKMLQQYNNRLLQNGTYKRWLRTNHLLPS